MGLFFIAVVLLARDGVYGRLTWLIRGLVGTVMRARRGGGT